MLKETTQTKNVARHLERNHKGVIQKIAQLNRVLTDLRYEGKSSYGKNLKRAEILLGSLNEDLSWDMEFEEEMLFPYLETRVPRLEFMIHVLHEEHEVLKRRLDGLDSLLRALFNKEDGAGRIKIVEKMRKKGNYLNYFLHQHTWAEEESVYRVMDAELSRQEKDELKKRCEVIYETQ